MEPSNADLYDNLRRTNKYMYLNNTKIATKIKHKYGATANF